jgi:pimeloyl-ACP methyl ester carboxylesterase
MTTPAPFSPKTSLVASLKASLVARPKGRLVARPKGRLVARPKGRLVARPKGRLVARPKGLAFIFMMVLLPTNQVTGADQQASPAVLDETSKCAWLTQLRLPDVRITEAVAQAKDRGVTVPHCRVSGVVGREIRFTLHLPDNWNQRFVMGGGGGFVGAVDNQALITVNDGFATVGTDTGHSALPFSAGWALNDVERRVNFGHVAVHRVAEVAKAIIASHYASAPRYSYFVGCSNGGRQAMMEAQRYPDDFDGIIAGAPALDFVGIGAQFIRDTRAIYPDPQQLADPLFAPEQLTLVESSVLAACDADDGVKDGVIDDPRTCRFDVATIPTCAGDQRGTSCLTRTQHAVLKQVYAPTTNASGEIYSAQPFGGESEAEGWRAWITGMNELIYKLAKTPSLRYAFGTEMFKYFIFNDPSFDYTKYDLSTWKKDTALAATYLNATNPNLDAFKASGGKVVLWHGWSDPALTALGSIKYYDQVEARDAQLRDYFRMYLMPGVLHCSGGPGPDRVNWASVITDWVEKGTAPESLVATKMVAGKAVRTRPLCPYPQHAVYRGAGSTDEASNFVCQNPR